MLHSRVITLAVSLEALVGDGVVSALRKGVAAKEPPYSEKKTDEKAAFLKCFNSIGRAGW